MSNDTSLTERKQRRHIADSKAATIKISDTSTNVACQENIGDKNAASKKKVSRVRKNNESIPLFAIIGGNQKPNRKRIHKEKTFHSESDDLTDPSVEKS